MRNVKSFLVCRVNFVLYIIESIILKKKKHKRRLREKGAKIFNLSEHLL